MVLETLFPFYFKHLLNKGNERKLLFLFCIPFKSSKMNIEQIGKYLLFFFVLIVCIKVNKSNKKNRGVFIRDLCHKKIFHKKLSMGPFVSQKYKFKKNFFVICCGRTDVPTLVASNFSLSW